MKKTLAVLAVLAVAAAAQAEMLATWSANGVDNKNDLATFGALQEVNGAGKASGGIYAVNKMNEGGGIGFSYQINSDYQVDNTKISGSYGGATSGPKQLDWYLGADATAAADTKITSAASIIRTGSTTGTFTDTDLGTLKGSGYVKLLANTAEGNYQGNTLASNGTFNFRTASGAFSTDALQLQGDVNPASAVPEPATMSLLGLGALAIALRRKLRK